MATGLTFSVLSPPLPLSAWYLWQQAATRPATTKKKEGEEI